MSPDLTEPRHQPGEPDDDAAEQAEDNPAVFAGAVDAGLRAAGLAALADRLDRWALTDKCQALPALGWTPAMIRRWAEHRGWPGAVPAYVVAAVGALGRPPQRPQSEVLARPGECPDHAGQPVGRCATCAAAASLLDSADHSSWAQAARARIRPLTPRDGLPLGQRDGGAE